MASVGRLIAATAALLFILGTSTAEAADRANPQLSAQIRGIDDASRRSEALRIASLDISVRIHGSLAETTLTARFENPGQDMLQGDFGLDMPRGSVVTGYALDVGGTLLDGVLLDQRQARTAYEAQVRRGVDPGLAEISRGFSFSTHIFPIRPGSGRTIRVRFATPLDPAQGYVLPLGSAKEVGRLTLSVEATGVAAPPSVRLPAGQAEWTRTSKGWRLSLTAEQARLDGVLAVGAPERAAPMLVSTGPSGERFFEIVDKADAAAGAVRAPRTVAILWDRSLSRADDDLAGEIALVRAYLERVRPESVDLLLFDAGGVERVRVAGAEQAVARLRSLRYVGGSSVASLARQPIHADACLIFTDGLITVDRREAFHPSCPLFAIASAGDADDAWLGALARATGGEAMHLAGGNGAQLLDRLTRRVPRVVGVRATTGSAIDFTSLDSGPDGWRIVGPMPAGGGVTVELAGGSGETRVYSAAEAGGGDVDAAAALWAADRLGVRAAADDVDRPGLVAFARHYSVAGPEIAFLVLETGADYANADVAPPPGLAADEMRAYRERSDERAKQRKRERASRLDEMLAQWNEQKAWWARAFDLRAKVPHRDRGQENGGPPPPPPPPPPAPPPVMAPQPPAAGLTAESAITVTGSRIPQPNLRTRSGNSGNPVTVMNYADALNNLPQLRSTFTSGGGSPPAAIEIKPWAPDRPYLAALRAASPADRERVMAEQQRQHGALPAFWLDVSEWHFAAGRRAEALATLLSALELPTKNSETLTIVADRLLRYGETDRAIGLYERLVSEQPDRPQPVRRLALAIAQRAGHEPAAAARTDLARAISLLTNVIMTPQDDRWDGIEMIALMEVNRLIVRYRALGGGAVPLDPRLIALLDTDLRIVIEWNSDDTDIDLWVDEPSGERAFYGDQRTRIGGHMSDDMTQGYGPEEYFLRRAAPGAYVVRADVFRNDRINPNGAARMTAHLIRDFGRPTERDEVVDIELSPKQDKEERLIGRLVVGPGDRNQAPPPRRR